MLYVSKPVIGFTYEFLSTYLPVVTRHECFFALRRRCSPLTAEEAETRGNHRTDRRFSSDPSETRQTTRRKRSVRLSMDKIPTEDLEGIFVEQLKTFLVSNDQVDAFLDRAREGLGENEVLLVTRKKEADRVRLEVDRTYRLYLDKEISSDAFGRFFRPIEGRQKQIEEEITKLQADVDLLKIDSFSRDQVMNDATYLQEAWPSLDQVEKRKIVDSITNKIVISKNEVEIDLCYLPSSKDISKRDRSLRGSNPQPPP